MNYQDYIASRERRSEEFRRLRQENAPLVRFQIALVAARLRAGLTQAQLADRLGVPQSSVSRWEHGTNIPTVEALQKISEVLGVNFRIGKDGLDVEDPRTNAVTA